MLTVAPLMGPEAKAGKVDDVAKFLETGFASANREATTPPWMA